MKILNFFLTKGLIFLYFYIIASLLFSPFVLGVAGYGLALWGGKGDTEYMIQFEKEMTEILPQAVAQIDLNRHITHILLIVTAIVVFKGVERLVTIRSQASKAPPFMATVDHRSPYDTDR
jgi:Na+/alanine symporter